MSQEIALAIKEMERQAGWKHLKAALEAEIAALEQERVHMDTTGRPEDVGAKFIRLTSLIEGTGRALLLIEDFKKHL